jgi:alkylation response protein AidB-like acyl-CoA dehydrogenase
MPFTPPVREQRLVLGTIAGIADLGVDDDTVDAVLEGAGEFAAGEWAPLARTGDTVGAKWTPEGVVMPQGFRAAYQAYVEGGWGTIGVAEAFGGQGLPFALQTAVLESLGTANMAFALCPTLTVGAIEALQHHGSPEQQALYLPKLATGEWTGTMNLTEPQAGSDVGALRSAATPLGDGKWSIKGTKIYISFGDHDMADNIVHLVLARTPDAPAGTRGISLFLVPKYRLNADGTPGAFNDVRVVSIEHKMGLHASPTCVLSFGDHDDCVGELIGAEHAGMRAMFTMMNNARLNVGLQGVQVAEGATQAAVAYALDRVQGARAGAAARIVEHPDVRRMLLRMKAQTQAARALVYYSAGQVDRAARGDAAAKNRLELVTPLAKAHATDLGNEVASLGIQVHGGMGYVEETGAAQFFRDARITPIYEGTNGIQAADLVGRKLALGHDEEGGGAFAALISDIRADAQDERLNALVDACEAVGRRLRTADADDRLAASYPFLTMLSVATCAWLLVREAAALTGEDNFAQMKRAAVRFYLEQIVPEALGLQSAATADAGVLYAVPAEAFAA